MTNEQAKDLREMKNDVYAAIFWRFEKYEKRGFNGHHRTQAFLEYLEKEWIRWLEQNTDVK